MRITPEAANHAADMIDGIVSHPFWGGIDKEALAGVRDALRSGTVTIKEDDEPMPSWGVPGDYMVFTGTPSGYESEFKKAVETFEVGKPYRIASTNIGRSSSDYTFEDVQWSWNTVMFAYADPVAIKQDWDDNRSDRKRRINACNTYTGYDIYENIVDD
jgi:hypothetical protein